MEVTLVVPCHDEVDNVEKLVERTHAALDGEGFDHEWQILLVDDNSTDGTTELSDTIAANDPNVEVLHRTSDPGFGSAIKAGLAEADGDVLVPFMGDLSDDPEDVPALVDAIEDGYDVAYGSRFVDQGSVAGYPRLKLFYNRAYNNLIRLLFGIRARDVTNAFTAYRREVIEEIGVDAIDADSFDITVELPLRAHIRGFSSTEVPVSWRSRDAGVSKLNATRKGPQYLERLVEMFVLGNVAGLKDLLGAVTDRHPVWALGAALIGIGILFGLFSITGMSDVYAAVSGADPVWLGGAAIAYFLSMVVRTWRFRVLLRTSGHLASRGGVFRCIMTGWFVNFLLPARAGDAARGVALKTTERVPFSVAGGMVVVERILDMLVLGGAMTLIVSLYLRTKEAALLAVGPFVLAALGLLGLLMIYAFGDRLAGVFEERIESVAAGLRTLSDALDRVAANPYAMMLSTLLSLPVWTFEASTIYFSARSVGIGIGPLATVTTAIAAFLAQAIPVTPAGIGTYEAVITSVLATFGVEPSTATAIALVDHFVRLTFVYVVGAVSTIHVAFRSRTFFRKKQSTNVTTPNTTDE